MAAGCQVLVVTHSPQVAARADHHLMISKMEEVASKRMVTRVQPLSAGSRREDLALHPTVKPVALVADAIQDVTRRGDLVLDTFLGSGTTAIAAARLGHPWLGVELSPDYAALAEKRVAAETAQGRLL